MARLFRYQIYSSSHHFKPRKARSVFQQVYFFGYGVEVSKVGMIGVAVTMGIRKIRASSRVYSSCSWRADAIVWQMTAC
jgi:hypothetical protein